jgi:hypothetical protein
MMRKRLVAAAAAALMVISGAASAQSFSDNFNSMTSLPQWTFTGVGTGLVNGAGADDFMRVTTSVPIVNPVSQAVFSFVATADTPYYLVQFRHTNLSDANIRFQAGALDETVSIPGTFPTTALTNPGGDLFSYYFGSPILTGTPVSLTITANLVAVSVDNFSVTAVPEPSTYALMLAGLGVVGFAARRRRSAAQQPTLATA